MGRTAAALALLSLVVVALVVAAQLRAPEPPPSATAYEPVLQACLITEQRILRCEATAEEPAFVP